jgi:thiol-disulfide isomerase/thioredoxin
MYFLMQSASAGAFTDSFIIGRRCPSFHLRNIEGWNKSEATLEDFRGKWLVLDFWNKGCGACVASFPKTNALKAKYGDRVNFTMVALQDKEDDIHQLWHKYRDHQKLTMPCAFDSLTFRQFGFYACPQVIVIDDKGIVRGTVYGISEIDLDGLLTGKKEYLTKPETVPFAFEQPFLLNGNGGNDTDFAYRSVISEWSGSMGSFRPGMIDYAVGQDLFQVSQVSLGDLFNLAYFGKCFISDVADPDYAKIFLHPLLEIDDSVKFLANYYTGSNLFAYSLKIRGANFSREQIMRIMQGDLSNYFQYSASVEIRDCPYLALLANDSARKYLQTKGGKKFRFEGSPHGKYSYYNTTIQNFLFLVGQSLTHEPVLPLLADETGIVGDIDITMDEVSTDQSSVFEALHRNGLDLVWKKRPMRVVVIRKSQITPSVALIRDTTAAPWR